MRSALGLAPAFLRAIVPFFLSLPWFLHAFSGTVAPHAEGDLEGPRSDRLTPHPPPHFPPAGRTEGCCLDLLLDAFGPLV